MFPLWWHHLALSLEADSCRVSVNCVCDCTRCSQWPACSTSPLSSDSARLKNHLYPHFIALRSVIITRASSSTGDRGINVRELLKEFSCLFEYTFFLDVLTLQTEHFGSSRTKCTVSSISTDSTWISLTNHRWKTFREIFYMCRTLS